MMLVRLVVTAVLLGLLAACSAEGIQPSSKLQQAIALQLEQTQQQLSNQLGVDFKGLEVNRVAVEQQELVNIENLPTFHVRGTYDLTLKLPKRRVTQQQNAFDVYLQRQQEGKTWRLLIPQSDRESVHWLSYLIR